MLERRPLVWNWHLDLLCDHLEAAAFGIPRLEVARDDRSAILECGHEVDPERAELYRDDDRGRQWRCAHKDCLVRRLLINIPPGLMKSLSVAVLWPTWVWTRTPQSQWIFTTYSGILAQRDARKRRQLVESDWYADMFMGRGPWTPEWRLAADQNNLRELGNTERGVYFTTSTGGATTGFRADYIVGDDPHAVREAQSPASLAEGVRYWNQELSTRRNDPDYTRMVAMGQRVAYDDLSGDIIRRGEKNPELRYWQICLPAHYDPDRHCKTPLGEDPRRVEGELLFPRIMSAEYLAELDEVLGPEGARAQLEQEPVPAGGGLFRADWPAFTLRYQGVPEEVARGCTVGGIFCDTMASPKGVGAAAAALAAQRAYVCIQAWGIRRNPTRYVLLGEVRARMGFLETGHALMESWRYWRRYLDIAIVGIENKAYGGAVWELHRHECPVIDLVEAGAASKIQRAQVAVTAYRNGTVAYPADEHAAWLTGHDGHLAEVLAFPGRKAKDRVDTAAHAIEWCRRVAVPDGEGGAWWM